MLLDWLLVFREVIVRGTDWNVMCGKHLDLEFSQFTAEFSSYKVCKTRLSCSKYMN